MKQRGKSPSASEAEYLVIQSLGSGKHFILRFRNLCYSSLLHIGNLHTYYMRSVLIDCNYSMEKNTSPGILILDPFFSCDLYKISQLLSFVIRASLA